ncbi:MAG: transcriptional regulator [Gemmatimonadota bacterium]
MEHPSLFDAPPVPPPGPGAAVPAAVSRAVSLDPLIHERVRLGIVTALAGSERRAFVELRDALGITDGNLSAHVRKLEQGGIVECRKRFEGRVPRSEYRLTTRGRAAFATYLFRLESILGAARRR